MELNCRNDPYYLVLQLDFAVPVDVPVAIDVDRLSFHSRCGGAMAREVLRTILHRLFRAKNMRN